VIRTVRPTDLPVLRAIQATALREPWPDLLATAATGRGGPLALVAIDARSPPVGYALAVPGESTAYLAELAVAPGRRGEGRGSALLSAVTDRLADAGCETVWLTARADDRRTLSFYRERGFTVRERLPGHYADGDGVELVR
jgi:ribosomal-protein-alanine N-acetyltransferase